MALQVSIKIGDQQAPTLTNLECTVQTHHAFSGRKGAFVSLRKMSLFLPTICFGMKERIIWMEARQGVAFYLLCTLCKMN